MPDSALTWSRSAGRRLAFSAADGLLTEANAAADHAFRMLQSLKAAGAKPKDLDALTDMLSDTFGSVQGGITKVLDDEGIDDSHHQIEREF